MNESSVERDPLEMLVSEFTERQRLGEQPTVEEYARKFPELADEIRDLFPMIAAVEQHKLQKEEIPYKPVKFEGVDIERLNGFRIVREIGRGGMGIVFEAEEESLGRRVAVKVLPRQLLLKERQLKRFQREAELAARLHHTNIVPVFGVGESDGFHYYVMQYIEGISLDEILADNWNTEDSQFFDDALAGEWKTPVAGGRTSDETIDEMNLGDFSAELGSVDQSLPAAGTSHSLPVPTPDLTMIVSVGIQAAGALHFAHEQGILHRDIKPGNLLLDGQGIVWVADFGLAKAIEGDDVSQSGSVVGTLRYMAPEQFRGQTDARSDVYSLGLTLYELLTLRPAWSADDRHSLINQILNGTLLRPRAVNPRIPRDLETIVLKATAREPEQRYQTAGELAADLRNFRDQRPIQAKRTSAVVRLWRWSQRNPVVAGLSVVTLALLVLVAVTANVGYRNEKQQREKVQVTSDMAMEALDKIFQRFAPGSSTSPSQLSLNESTGSDADILHQPAISKETAALLESLLKYYDELAEESTGDASLQAKSAEARVRVGDIHQRLGAYELAIAAYRRAIEMFQEIDPTAGEDLVTASIKIASLQNEIGTAQRMLADEKNSKKSYQAALAILEPLQETETLRDEVRYQLARTHFLLAWKLRPGEGSQMNEAGNDLPLAEFGPRQDGPPIRPVERRRNPGDERHLKLAIEILENLVGQVPVAPRVRHLLARCYREESGDRFSERVSSEHGPSQKAIQLLEGLVDEFPEVPEYRFALAESYSGFTTHGPSLDYDDFPRAEQVLLKSLQHAKVLVADHPNVLAYTVSLVHIHHKLAFVVERQGEGAPREIHREKMAKAERNYRAAIDLQAMLIRRFPESWMYQVWLCRFQNALAGLLNREDRLEESLALVENAVSRLAETLQQNSENRYLQRSASSLHRSLAETFEQLGELELAVQAALDAEEYRKKLGLPIEEFDSRPDRPGRGPRPSRRPPPRRERFRPEDR